MLNIIKKFISKHKPHRCKPKTHPETGEVITFHWDVPWSFSQKFTVCQECDKVKVISEIRNDNRGRYRKEENGKKWSRQCDYAKVPSIGKDKLIVSRTDI